MLDRTERRCLACEELRPIEEFGHDYHRKDGLKTRCRACNTSYMREYRKRPGSKEKIKAIQARCHQKRKHTDVAKKTQRRAFDRWKERSPKFNLYMALRHAVRRRPTDNPITIEYLMEMWGVQHGLCAVSGVPMTWSRGKLMATSVSIDRIDQKIGYAVGNVRLVCYQVNTFRGMWSDSEMLTMAKAIVAHMEPAPRRLVMPQDLEVEYTTGALSFAA